jgi:benzoate/toluate 1,2-dioxygenase alpha subunit
VRTEDEGLFVLQHKYWQETMLKAAEAESQLIPVEAVQ